jgi:hypothetical protein
MVWYILLRPLRPELDVQDKVQILMTNLVTSTNDHMIRPHEPALNSF